MRQLCNRIDSLDTLWLGTLTIVVIFVASSSFDTSVFGVEKVLLQIAQHVSINLFQ